MQIPFKHDLSHSFPEGLRNREQAKAAHSALLAEAAGALARVRDERGRGSMPHWALPSRRDDLPPLAEVAEELRTRFDGVVVLGTGGSSLGGRALVALCEGRPRTGAWVRFCDNLDPVTMEALLRDIDPGRTAFVVISKSGATGETLVQALVCLDGLQRRAPDVRPSDHMVVVCEPGTSPLRQLAANHRLRVFDHDPDLGGRYSVLSVVGALPAMVADLDFAAVRNGAEAVLQQAVGASDAGDVPAASGAAAAVALARECGVATNVLLPYCDRLDVFALWHSQLWAESLGKDGKGMTPVRALGPVDQHSQLQLYLDGPADKQFTLLLLDQEGEGPRVPGPDAEALGAGYLAGAAVGDLVSAQQRATADTMASHGRPVRVFHLPHLDEYVLGGLFQHFMLETVVAAHLLGVDPFDQPAVEEGKLLARRYLAERLAARAAL
jgi:glucose-6-phosphate isomerase